MTKDEALKMALNALEANYLLVNGTETHGGLEKCLDGYYSVCFDTDPINKQTEEAITAIKEALAQSEQEPVAWITPDGEGFRIRFSLPVNDVPLGWNALYTTPPQRKPLTDERLETMAEKYVTNCYFDTLQFARAIEAAHGIKE